MVVCKSDRRHSAYIVIRPFVQSLRWRFDWCPLAEILHIYLAAARGSPTLVGIISPLKVLRAATTDGGYQDAVAKISERVSFVRGPFLVATGRIDRYPAITRQIYFNPAMEDVVIRSVVASDDY